MLSKWEFPILKSKRRPKKKWVEGFNDCVKLQSHQKDTKSLLLLYQSGK